VRSNETPSAPTAPQDVEYQVVNKTPEQSPSAQQLLVLNVGSGVEESGSDGKMSYVVSPPNNHTKFEVTDDFFNPLKDVGKTLRVVDSFYGENRGEFVITAVPDTKTVHVERLADPGWLPVAESALHWELSYQGRFDQKSLRVVYDSVRSFSAVDAFAGARENHIMTANTLVKAFNPVYLGMTLFYRVKDDATRLLDETSAIQHLVAYINNYPENATINVSDIVSEFNTVYRDVVGYVQLPITVDYTLIAPDGRRIFYSTQDDIRITPGNLSSLDPADRLEDAKALGVVEDTVRYLTDERLIELVQVS